MKRNVKFANIHAKIKQYNDVKFIFSLNPSINHMVVIEKFTEAWRNTSQTEGDVKTTNNVVQVYGVQP